MTVLVLDEGYGTEEGDTCFRAGCCGVIDMQPDGRCRCAVSENPPCSACENSFLICTECFHELRHEQHSTDPYKEWFLHDCYGRCLIGIRSRNKTVISFSLNSYTAEGCLGFHLKYDIWLRKFWIEPLELLEFEVLDKLGIGFPTKGAELLPNEQIAFCVTASIKAGAQ